MRLMPTLMATLVLTCGCSTPQSDMEKKLSRYHVGDLESMIQTDLRLSEHPSRQTPNLPIGEEHAIYFLPSGNLHVMTSVNESGTSVLSVEPFFIFDTTPVAEREKEAEESWDQYVKTLKTEQNGPNKMPEDTARKLAAPQH